MTLEQAALLAEIVGAAAVVVSLVYLALEVRRNTDATRSATHQTQVDSTVSMNIGIAANTDLAAIIAKSNAEMSNLTPGEVVQLNYHYVSHFNLWHSAYWNVQRGLLREQAWRTWEEGMAFLFEIQPACTTVWGITRRLYDSEFQSHVDGLISKVQAGAHKGV